MDASNAEDLDFQMEPSLGQEESEQSSVLPASSEDLPATKAKPDSMVPSPTSSTFSYETNPSPDVVTDYHTKTASILVSLGEQSVEGNSDSSMMAPSPVPTSYETTPTPVPTSASVSAADPLMNKICSSTDYPDICLSTVTPRLRGKDDPMAILFAALDASNEFTKTCLLTSKQIAQDPRTPPDMATIYRKCKSSFEDAQDDIKSAIEALSTINDYNTANTRLSAVITYSSDCQDEHNGKKSLVFRQSEMLWKLASNSLAIISVVYPS